MCEIGINCVYWWYIYYGYSVFKTFPLTVYFMYDWKTYIIFSCIFSKREAVTKLRSERWTWSPHNDHSVLPEPWKTAFLGVSLGHQTPDVLWVQEDTRSPPALLRLISHSPLHLNPIIVPSIGDVSFSLGMLRSGFLPRIPSTDFLSWWSADTNADSDASSLCNWYVSSLITINFFSDKVIL